MSMTFQWRMLLPGGAAVSAECGLQDGDCETARYTKRGNTVSMDVEGDVLFDETIRPFSPGTRLGIAVGNVSGGALMSTSVLSSGDLQMTRDGRISVGSWAGTSTQGGNFNAHTSNGGAVSGRYYIDGYLLAILDDATGEITVGTLFEKIEGGDRYYYLNGELFWE